jgi:hypothetical protein
MPKLSKSEIDYSLGMKESHCGKAFEDDQDYCRYFIPPRQDQRSTLAPASRWQVKSVGCFGAGCLLRRTQESKCRTSQPSCTRFAARVSRK